MGNLSSIYASAKKYIRVAAYHTLHPAHNNLDFQNGTNFEILDFTSKLLIQHLMVRLYQVLMHSLKSFNKAEKCGVDTLVGLNERKMG